MGNPFSPHLVRSKELWASHLSPSDGAIDATCGNGHDTLFLSRHLTAGYVVAIDIQPTALQKTRERVQEVYPNNLKSREFDKEAPQNFRSERATIAARQGASEDENSEAKPTWSKTDFSVCLGINNVHFYCMSHAEIDRIIVPFPPKLIVYNLGYLPGGDKTLTTCTESTLQSVEKALSILPTNGALSITCYPGHDEGFREEKALLEWTKTKHDWDTQYYQWQDRQRSPTLLWIKKKILNHFTG